MNDNIKLSIEDMNLFYGNFQMCIRDSWNTDQKCFLYLQKKTTKYGRGLSAES